MVLLLKKKKETWNQLKDKFSTCTQSLGAFETDLISSLSYSWKPLISKQYEIYFSRKCLAFIVRNSLKELKELLIFITTSCILKNLLWGLPKPLVISLPRCLHPHACKHRTIYRFMTDWNLRILTYHSPPLSRQCRYLHLSQLFLNFIIRALAETYRHCTSPQLQYNPHLAPYKSLFYLIAPNWILPHSELFCNVEKSSDCYCFTSAETLEIKNWKNQNKWPTLGSVDSNWALLQEFYNTKRTGCDYCFILSYKMPSIQSLPTHGYFNSNLI